MSVVEIAEIVRGHGTPLLQAADEVDEVVRACATAVRPHVLRVRGRGADLAARLDHLPSGVGLSRLHYGADVTISGVAPEQDEFIVVLPVAGRARFDYGQATAVLGPGTMSVVSPYQPFTLEIDRDFDQVLVRLDRRRVESTAAALTGASGAAPVHFELESARISPGLVGLIDAAAHVAADPHVAQRNRLVRQVETLVIEALLLGYPSNLSGRLAGAATSPSAERVHRAMDYMLVNLADQISLSDVARHCGVTLRSLQLGFRREVGMSPGEWLRNQRLERAHAQLANASETETTVTAVSLACGFPHLGDFAARFKQRFGESPSTVLRGSRR
ncbi:AraC-like DNA-binding protein [Nocardioides luteus]|uniref:helix-turn-helix transcriptional regulator n=1 Tax=Nocardioides luteus TaxID=1844 RepID=UPI00166842A7|nr:AraC family transcriptional regulator [Nocardioides luteus]MDR7313622.1 AraC-like DNA-binding protein [Nocardioides luteus]